MGLSQKIEDALTKGLGIEEPENGRGNIPIIAKEITDAIIEFLQEQTFTITEMKAPLEVEEIDTAAPLQADVLPSVTTTVPPGIAVATSGGPGATTSPTTAPVKGPVNAVAFTVPDTSNFVVGVVVPIPTLDSDPSMVSTVVVTPPSLTLNVMSVSCTVLEIIAPVVSTVTDISESAPMFNPVSLVILSVPDVVSFTLDLKKLAAAIPPSASASVAVPLNFKSEIAVDKVIPFVIDEKPDIADFGVKVSSDIIAMRLPSLNNFVMLCDASPESNIVSNVNPFVVPVELGGPTNTDAVPL